MHHQLLTYDIRSQVCDRVRGMLYAIGFEASGGFVAECTNGADALLQIDLSFTDSTVVSAAAEKLAPLFGGLVETRVVGPVTQLVFQPFHRVRSFLLRRD